MFLGKSTRIWIRSLIAAAVGAAAGAVPVVIIDPQTFNPFDHGSLAKLGAVVAVSMLLAVAMYLKEHPLPTLDDALDAAVVANQHARQARATVAAAVATENEKQSE